MSAVSAKKSNQTQRIRATSRPCAAPATASRLQSESDQERNQRSGASDRAVTNGIFLKLMAAFAVVILATAVTFDAMLGRAVRLAYPLSDVEAVALQMRHRLELASALAFL